MGKIADSYVSDRKLFITCLLYGRPFLGVCFLNDSRCISFYCLLISYRFITFLMILYLSLNIFFYLISWLWNRFSYQILCTVIIYRRRLDSSWLKSGQKQQNDGQLGDHINGRISDVTFISGCRGSIFIKVYYFLSDNRSAWSQLIFWCRTNTSHYLNK